MKETMTSLRFPEIHADLMRRFKLDLTDAQIETIARTDKDLWDEVRVDCSDTFVMEHFIDAMVDGLMGADTNWHWPMNMDSDDYKDEFHRRFDAACWNKGIKWPYNNPQWL